MLGGLCLRTGESLHHSKILSELELMLLSRCCVQTLNPRRQGSLLATVSAIFHKGDAYKENA